MRRTRRIQIFFFLPWRAPSALLWPLRTLPPDRTTAFSVYTHTLTCLFAGEIRFPSVLEERSLSPEFLTFRFVWFRFLFSSFNRFPSPPPAFLFRSSRFFYLFWTILRFFDVFFALLVISALDACCRRASTTSKNSTSQWAVRKAVKHIDTYVWHLIPKLVPIRASATTRASGQSCR